MTREPGQDPGPERADDATDGGAEPELDHLRAAGARRHERDGEHAVAHHVGVLPGVRHDAHPAHGVPEEHDGAGGAGRLEDRREVPPQLGDGAGLQGRLAGATVPPLVVRDDPETRVDERAALQHPRLHRQGEPVHQHDGGGAPSRVPTAPGRRLGRVDLDVEGDPVLGRHDERLGRYVGPPVGGVDGAEAGAGARDALAEDARRHTERGQGTQRHQPRPPRCTRGSRGPMRVTIS